MGALMDQRGFRRIRRVHFITGSRGRDPRAPGRRQIRGGTCAKLPRKVTRRGRTSLGYGPAGKYGASVCRKASHVAARRRVRG